MKRVSKIEWEMGSNIKKVWETVTNLDDCDWRSDLSKIEKINEQKFIEHFKSGGQTTFVITDKEFCKKYCFDMENKFFIGTWTGIFIKLDTQKTKLIFSEELNIKNPFIWALSFLVMNLKRIQKEYMQDLERKLSHD
ncbi:polyketide cyclase [Vagococcus vulneris]|uniref:Polyketide cyclase n=1 Tax=Vagococcus vulneris TaxID=1977869 RepID=A0A430A125_9ENTE|nr:hypothetical protein [Vagococcus vulneris]RSU00080.1 hypothetical protein CBF37_01905 [Vagococcus vulneris]